MAEKKGTLQNLKLGDGFCRIVYKYPPVRWFNIGAYSVLKMMLEKGLQISFPNTESNPTRWLYEPHTQKAKVRSKKEPRLDSGEFHVACNMSDLRGFVDEFIKKQPQYRCYFLPDELKSGMEVLKPGE